MKGQEVNTTMNAGKSSKLGRCLRTSAVPYRILFEKLPISVCWVSLSGRILYSNPTMLKLTGYSDAEIVEIVTHVALNTLTNYINEVFKTEVDFPVVQVKLAA